MRWRLDLPVLALLGAGVVAASALLALVLAAQGGGGLADATGLGVAIGALIGFYLLSVVWILWRRPPWKAALTVAVVVGMAARLVLAFGQPVLSRDAYRYVWDGRIQAHGINPYAHAPGDAALAPLRDDAVYPHIDRKGAPTIYPPAAQATFRLAYALRPNSVIGLKLLLVAVEAVSILLLALVLARVRLGPERAILYAWHPLAIVEVGQSGHIDAVAVPLVLLALLATRRSQSTALAGVLLGVAALVKLYALAVLPAFRTRSARRAGLVLAGAAGATLAAGYTPFLGVGTRVVGYLPGYLREEGFTSGRRFYLFEQLERLIGHGSPGPVALGCYLAFVAAVTLAVGVWCWRTPLRRPADTARRALALALLALALASPHYPWYALLAAALLPFGGGALLFLAMYTTTAVALLYVNLKVPSHPPWPLHLVYGATLAGLVALGVRHAWRKRATEAQRMDDGRRSPSPGVGAMSARLSAGPKRPMEAVVLGARERD